MQLVSRKCARFRVALPLAALCFCAALSASAQNAWDRQPTASTADGLAVLNAFYAGGSNTAAVAVAKAAIATFGYPGVFATPPVDDGTHTRFNLRDGSSITVANADLARGKAAAKFLTDYPSANPAIAEQAATLYALMIVRVMALAAPNNVFHDASSWSQAGLLLSGNMGTKKQKRTLAARDLAQLLGLKNAPLPFREPLAYIHTHGDQAAFATGKFIDQGGTATSLWKFDLLHGHVLHPGLTGGNADFVLTQ